MLAEWSEQFAGSTRESRRRPPRLREYRDDTACNAACGPAQLKSEVATATIAAAAPMSKESRRMPAATRRLAATSSSDAFVVEKSSCSIVPLEACARHVFRLA